MNSSLHQATFGLGCFWGPDARLGVYRGVRRTRVGYAGGTTPAPTYQQIGDHTEVVQVDFDPDRCTYRDLLSFFWDSHNPDRAHYKRQYRSVILAENSRQLAEARAALKEERDGRSASLSTRVEELDRFYLAEDYHQKYRLRRDATLMVEFEEQFADSASFRESPHAAKVNGFVAGHGSEDQLIDYLESSFLSAPARRHLRLVHG